MHSGLPSLAPSLCSYCFRSDVSWMRSFHCTSHPLHFQFTCFYYQALRSLASVDLHTFSAVAAWVSEHQKSGDDFATFLSLPPGLQQPRGGLTGPSAAQWIKVLCGTTNWIELESRTWLHETLPCCFNRSRSPLRFTASQYAVLKLCSSLCRSGAAASTTGRRNGARAHMSSLLLWQHLEAPLAWAAWAVDHGVVTAEQLVPPRDAASTSATSTNSAAGAHAAPALLAFLEAAAAAREGKGFDRGCVAPGAERSTRHLTLAAIEFHRRVGSV